MGKRRKSRELALQFLYQLDLNSGDDPAPHEDEFWSRLETARDHARSLAQRIREGDVDHDPRGGSCPAWCDLWRICRVARA